VFGAAVRAGGLDAVVLRPFSVYGPGARREGVLGLILEQALAGDRIRLRKLDGIRDYCFVDDLAAAVWQAATLDLGGLHTFNIASGTGTRVDDLALATLAARHGTLPDGASVELAPTGNDGDRPAAADIDELIADVTAAREVLGWSATTDLADGLARTLAWYAGTTSTD
jgi:nucleoside-diphosphate-sugar epimerase